MEPGDALAERLSSDAAFDRVYDRKIRALSGQHWTPVAVAARAADLLTRAGATRILDVGAGVGKFCIVGALSTAAEFVGVERREGLVKVARRAAARLGSTRATFVHANIDTFSFDGFEGVYLYNPFYEQISKFLPLIDREIGRSVAAHRYFVRTTIEKLLAAAPPLLVAAYHGFGGEMPPEFERMGAEPAGNDQLEMWIKR
ncbi:MAG TPA: class I SAM-dependent methyltransferase [Polyangia bacterium]